jgi:hypothetical protein
MNLDHNITTKTEMMNVIMILKCGQYYARSLSLSLVLGSWIVKKLYIETLIISYHGFYLNQKNDNTQIFITWIFMR